MTLMEVLVGVLLLVLVGALGYSLVLGTRRSFDRQSDSSDLLVPVTEGLDVLVQDLMGCLIPPSGEAPYFLLSPGTPGAELTLVTAVPPSEKDAPLSRFHVERVAWRLEPDPETGTTALWRRARVEGVSGTVEEKRFSLPAVTGFDVRVYDPGKRDWVETWAAGRDGTLPAGGRIKLTVRTSGGSETLEVDTVIPAGMTP
jgi:hypothetical protein